jgi:16S rRNA G966 N2-methylase RsmD
MVYPDFTAITKPEVQDYLFLHEKEDERQLALKHPTILGLPSSVMASQLKGRRTAKEKFPTWYKTKGIVYPPTIHLEQASSEATALFKKQIVTQELKQKLTGADLTGGAGIDSMMLSSVFKTFHYFEPDKNLFDIARHNHRVVGLKNVQHHALSADEFLNTGINPFDLIYIDPSRRKAMQKVVRLADCAPDVVALQDALFQRSAFLLIKVSPLLDIQQAIRELKHVKRAYVVAVENECKELLFLAEKNYEGVAAFQFTMAEEKSSFVTYRSPLVFLYEPFACILKSGGFKSLAQKFPVIKISANTHLYTSAQPVSEFPGRIFRILELNPSEKRLRQLLPDGQANVLVRNYPVGVEGLKKKLRLKDGGSHYLIGFSEATKRHLAFCERITNT